MDAAQQAPARPSWRTSFGVDARPKPGFVPYAGADPPPSHRLGRAMIAVGLGAAATRFATAVLWLQRATIDTRLEELTRRGLPADAAFRSDLRSSASHLHLASSAWLVTGLFFVGLDIIWMQRRRPRSVLAARGEAFVEAPLTQVIPVWARLAVASLVAAGLLTASLGTPTLHASASRLTTARWWAAANSAMWGSAVMVGAMWPVLAERAHLRRVQASGPARAGAESVPYVPPLDGGSVEVRSDWLIGTAAIVIGLTFGGLVFFGGLAAASGNPGTLPWTLAGGVAFGLAVRAIVRRRRTGNETSAPG